MPNLQTKVYHGCIGKNTAFIGLGISHSFVILEHILKDKEGVIVLIPGLISSK